MLHTFSRQEEGLPRSTAASVNNGDLPPLSRSGSPTTAEKDILVSCSFNVSQKENDQNQKKYQNQTKYQNYKKSKSLLVLLFLMFDKTRKNKLHISKFSLVLPPKLLVRTLGQVEFSMPCATLFYALNLWKKKLKYCHTPSPISTISRSTDYFNIGHDIVLSLHIPNITYLSRYTLTLT